MLRCRRLAFSDMILFSFSAGISLLTTSHEIVRLTIMALREKRLVFSVIGALFFSKNPRESSFSLLTAMIRSHGSCVNSLIIGPSVNHLGRRLDKRDPIGLDGVSVCCCEVPV